MPAEKRHDHQTDSEREEPLDACGALASRAYTLAAFAALKYLALHCEEFKPGTKTHDAIHDRLTPALALAVADAIPAALDDARAALACNMEVAACATFAASMRLAGIAAAKAAISRPGV